MLTVKIGFVPSYRFRYTPWCQKMRDDSLAAFAAIEGLHVVVPQPSPDGEALDAEKGHTPHGMVTDLDEERRLIRADGFLSVDGRVIYAMKDFTLRMAGEGR